MNLEQRVQALEQEVELLKAQIQATLLDIQEQLLNNAYPTLRAESPVLPAASISEQPSVAPPPVKRVVIAESQPDDDFEDDEPDDEMPVVRKAPVTETPTQPSVPEQRDWMVSEVGSQRDSNARDWIELEEWVSQKVEKLGIARTRELIDLYGREQRFTRQERVLLMQFVDIYDDGEQKPLDAPAPKKTRKQPTIVPQTRAVVEEIRTELREKRAQTNGQKTLPQEELSEHQGLVLRLIAGILNAGDETD